MKAAMVETARALARSASEGNGKCIERLVKNGIAVDHKADNARSALAAARSQLEAAQADVDRLTVVAPFSGVIDQVMVEEGGWMPSGEAVAVLLQLDPVVALGEVSERDISHVDVGREADVRLISGDIVSGAVRHISLEATPGTRTFPIEIAIANPDNRIPAGMTAEIMIKSEAVTAVRLPRSVVTLDAAGNLGLRIVNADNTVGFRADRSDRRFARRSGAQRGAAGRQRSSSPGRIWSVRVKPSTPCRRVLISLPGSDTLAAGPSQ
jgi:multidrug efflux system membrane fusion protein